MFYNAIMFLEIDLFNIFSLSWTALGQHFEQVHHSLQMADHFVLHREHLFDRPSLNILHHCLMVLSLTAVWQQPAAHNSRWI
jgi:hypothetical protein